jgi:O-antigen/teichoic acid export membrane protein
MRRLLTPALNLLCICIVYLFWGLSLKAVLTVFIAVNTLLTLWFFLKIKAVTSLRFSIDWLIVKSLFSYGLKSYTQTLTGHLIYQIDIYIIAYLLGARQVAFYAIAVGIATLLWYIPNTVGVVLFPTLSSVKDDNKIHEFSAQVCRHTMFITSLAALALGLAGKYIILFIYGAEYNNSVNSMLLILPGIIVMSLYKVLTRNFSSRNKQQVSIMAAGIALVVNIGLNLLWIPQFGIEGAALASTVSYILASALLVIRVRMESDLTIREMLFVNRTDLKNYSGIISKLRKIY